MRFGEMAAEERSDVLDVGVGSADTRLPLLVFQPGQAHLVILLELLLVENILDRARVIFPDSDQILTQSPYLFLSSLRLNMHCL